MTINYYFRRSVILFTTIANMGSYTVIMTIINRMIRIKIVCSTYAVRIVATGPD